MSDEIFTRGYRELQNANDGDDDLMAAENPNDIRLQDIEQQLEMAESRCNTLKDQLDYMKQMYGGNKSSNKSRKISNVANLSNHSSTSNEETTRPISVKKSGPSRQKSNAIETDNSGAAVRTINNILNGITNSVNRLSEIHSQITTPRAKSATSGNECNFNCLYRMIGEKKASMTAGE
ncbi:uncharacterized protein LOC115876135 [Sitophilus oryzae]|uniref:Uncharacterized protein LOC115876135 n=1 Tax=Sitophilus oryzae TaxID=7048 RepID=A0A6J2X8X2_SITOR|nr:uncharacterized protein LOC115876135 [Sitophilus oryzae]